MWTVYTLADPRDGIARYVGCTSMTLGKRRARHVCSARTAGRTDKKSEWIRSLLADGVKPTITALCAPVESKELAAVLERDFQQKIWLERIFDKRPQLLNKSNGGLATVPQDRIAELNSAADAITGRREFVASILARDSAA